MASKTMLVAQREYLENVRTKTFWLGIFLVPVLIAACIGVGALLKDFKGVQRYAVIDLGGEGLVERAERELRKGDLSALSEAMAEQQSKGEISPELQPLAEMMANGEKPTAKQQLDALNWWMNQPQEVQDDLADLKIRQLYEYVDPDEIGITETDPEKLQEALTKAVNEGELFGLFVLGKDPLKSFDDFLFVCDNQADTDLQKSYGKALTRVIQSDRIKSEGIRKRVADHIQETVNFAKTKRKSTADGKGEDVEKEDVADQWAPMGFVYFLWMAIFSIANLLLTNTVEEKSNRIIEVLLSSVSPAQLMHGKIFGIAFTGLTIVGTWVFFALVASWIAPALLGDSGEGIAVLIAAISNTSYLLSFVLYFLGGFLLYAAVLCAIGSVCNTLKEAQNLMQPVMMILMVPLISMVFITQEPNGMVAKVLSFIPLFTPFTMMNRAGGPPETWEYIVTTILLLLTIWLTFKAAGKVFRVGVLMTGNPPKLKEIFGWLRQS